MSETTPKFLGKFSKETGKESRRHTAKEILNVRREKQTMRGQLESVGHMIESLQSERARLEVDRLEVTRRNIINLQEKLAELEATMFLKVKNFLEISRLRKQIIGGQETQHMAEVERDTLATREAGQVEIRRSLELARDLIPRGEDLIADFYEHEQQRWQSSRVEWEDVDKNFSVEHLVRLPLNEYIALLRRFPQEMVTHVSRRGIRDHQLLEEHNTGVGEFHDSFDQVLTAKRLQSAIARQLEQDSKNAYVGGELNLTASDTSEIAEDKLRQVMGRAGWASFADFSAVHFAAEAVADDYYGAERGNEHFIVFPSALIAAEYDFGGHYADLSGQKTVDRYRNDVWVWAKEQEGIPIDAGVIFLPKEARVDSETGSRYALTADRKPIVNTQMIDMMDTLHTDDMFGKMIVDAHRVDSVLRDSIRDETRREFGYSTNHEREQEQERTVEQRYATASAELQKGVKARLEQEFGVTDQRLQNALVSYEGARLMQMPKRPDDPFENYTFTRNRLLMSAGLYFQEAKQTIPAEEFWKDYFRKHPDRQPSKVVYYEGADPMAALQRWREENGIVRTSKELGIDFESRARKVAGGPESSGTRTRFESIAREVISEHFSRRESSPISVVEIPSSNITERTYVQR